MRQPHRGVRRIDALPAWTRGAERIDTDVLGFELDLDFIGFRQHGDGDCRCVNPPLLLGLRYALHAMHAALVLKLAVDALAADQGDDFLDPAHRRITGGGYFDLPPARLREAPVHAE